MAQHTERKHCDECGKETTWLKKTAIIIETECLPCQWETLEDYWKEQITETSFDQAKKDWEEVRNSNFNKEIILELTSEEKDEWNKTKAKINTLLTSQKDKKNQEQPFNWTPWLIGGGVMIIVLIIGLVLYFNHQKKNK